MKRKTITINLIPDRETGYYYAEVVTDESLTMIRDAFDSLTHASGNIIAEKVRHTNEYLIKRKIKVAFKKAAYLLRAVFNGIRSGYQDDYKKQNFEVW